MTIAPLNTTKPGPAKQHQLGLQNLNYVIIAITAKALAKTEYQNLWRALSHENRRCWPDRPLSDLNKASTAKYAFSLKAAQGNAHINAYIELHKGDAGEKVPKPTNNEGIDR
ncbi:hypothetical protein N7495_002094 [Penicillium taxi]|uniref:uncharacterized protein n=1 Tax=Penicillium taxi TaxID=168475 RepID=UPI002545B8BC|nr:uncharacterized protein N7495_002094 [Penicillium taxi]KAJ5901566.1 hypothetical protein N7495_002094 [Penicillium taxi]